MSETLSREDFDHLLADGMKNLEIEKGKLLEAKQAADLGPLDTDLMKTLILLFEKLSAAQDRGPEETFKAALEAINAVDARRFILENLLEGLKREDNVDIQKLMTRYQQLGLLPIDADPKNPVTKNRDIPFKGTLALIERKSIWERVGIVARQIAITAFKSIPKFVEIEPSITFVGLIPCLSFKLKGKGISCHDLFELFRKASSPAWPSSG